jgi:hypothetical protein
MPLAAEMEQGTYLSTYSKAGAPPIDRSIEPTYEKQWGEYINVAGKVSAGVMGTEHVGHIAGDARPAPACS